MNENYETLCPECGNRNSWSWTGTVETDPNSDFCDRCGREFGDNGSEESPPCMSLGGCTGNPLPGCESCPAFPL